MLKTAALVLLLACPTLAFAQQNSGMSAMVGTLSVRAEPMLTSGKLQGCSIVFNALTTDWKYRNGAYLKIDGSVVISISETGAGAMLKVVANEVVTAANGSLTFAPSAPTRAYLVGDGYKTNADTLHKSGASDTPGGMISIFEMFPTADIVAQAMVDKKLTIAFNQKGGGSDLILPLDLNVADIDANGNRKLGSTASTEFLDCMQVLLQANKTGKAGRVAPNN